MADFGLVCENDMNDAHQNINRNTMKARMKAFALRVITMVDSLPSRMSINVLSRQLVRSATSVSANYRAAPRARSRKEFIAKLGIVEEEVDESAHWIELLIECGAVTQEKAGALLEESNELTAIVIGTIRTARQSKSEIHNPKSEI